MCSHIYGKMTHTVTLSGLATPYTRVMVIIILFILSQDLCRGLKYVDVVIFSMYQVVVLILVKLAELLECYSPSAIRNGLMTTLSVSWMS